MKKKDKSRVGSQSGLSPDHHGAVSGPYGGSPEPKSFTGPIVQKIFAESAGLGIKFGARTNLVKVEGIVDDSQAARVGGLVSSCKQHILYPYSPIASCASIWITYLTSRMCTALTMLLRARGRSLA